MVDFDDEFACEICNTNFESTISLMKHKKENHSSIDSKEKEEILSNEFKDQIQMLENNQIQIMAVYVGDSINGTRTIIIIIIYFQFRKATILQTW